MVCQQATVCVDHQVDEGLERRLRSPAEGGLGEPGVAPQLGDLAGPAQGAVAAHVVRPVEPDPSKGALGEVSDGVEAAGREHIVARLVRSGCEPGSPDVVPCETPVATSLQVAEDERLAAPSAIRAAADVILRDTKWGARRGDSWL